MTDDGTAGGRVLLAVTGSIAAYKAADVVSLLRKRGHSVRCMMTENAARFVTPLVLETLTESPVHSALFGPDVSGTEHIRLARWADVLVIAPATANVLAKLAVGLADDLVTTVALATRAPWVVAPAMNTAMWEHPSTAANLAALKSRGVFVIDPADGMLACGEQGAGKLASSETVVAEIEAVLAEPDLTGMRVLVTSGPTTSHIDAVRYITNHSTGRMGAAMAEEAARRGAEVVCLVGIDKGVVIPSAPSHAKGNIAVIRVRTAAEMLAAGLHALPRVDGVVAAAAVLDYDVADPASGKRRRSADPVSLRLEPSPDVLAGLRAHARDDQWFCGFAAEIDDIERAGAAKLTAKRLDYLFVNRIAAAGEELPTGFGSETNSGVFLSRRSECTLIPLASKREVAGRLWDLIKASQAASSRE